LSLEIIIFHFQSLISQLAFIQDSSILILTKLDKILFVSQLALIINFPVGSAIEKAHLSMI